MGTRSNASNNDECLSTRCGKRRIAFSSVAVVILIVAYCLAPIFPVRAGINGTANMNVLQFKWYTDQNALFTALQAGQVDSMQWPLTKTQYQAIQNNTAITVESVPGEAGEYEIAFNNNVTDGLYMDRRSPMNYTDFRNAMNCLVERMGVINGPTLGGYAVPDYTQVPDPYMADYVNRAVSGANYPWQFNVTHALQILYDGGWYSTSVYPTFASLITAYGGGTGPLGSAGGTTSGVIYPANDPNDQGWGLTDTNTGKTAYGVAAGPNAYTVEGVAGQPIQLICGFERTSDARKDLGDYFTDQLVAIGCPNIRPELRSIFDGIRPYVLAAQHYDWATLGYNLSVPPNWWCTELTPAGIYPNGPNPYLVDDANTTYYATKALNDPDPGTFNIDQKTVQYNLVMESYLVSAWSPATYCAYKTGLLGSIDVIGQGTEANGGQVIEWDTMMTSKVGAVVFTGPPPSTPSTNILNLGLAYPPDMINPIFQDTMYDFQVTDQIFTYPIGSNPYTVTLGSAITSAPSGSDLPCLAYSWKTALVSDPYNSSNPQWTDVTLWLRHDITWQDGVPFTAQDINYTIYINALYGDAYDNSAMVYAANVSLGAPNPDGQYEANPGDPNYAAPYTSIPDPYTINILVKSPSWLNLYLPLYQEVPQHVYKYITPANMTAAELGTDVNSLHGAWPGQAALPVEVSASAPFTQSELTDGSSGWQYTLVGCGPWMPRSVANGQTFTVADINAAGGITLDAYQSFFLKPAAGAIALKYTWLNTATSSQPSGGYFKIGLSDLVYLANAYGTAGDTGSVPLGSVAGTSHVWNPGANIAAPSGTIGLLDLVTLATHYGWYYGNYSYNAPYPPAEVAHGGP